MSSRTLLIGWVDAEVDEVEEHLRGLVCVE
jgi:hypothetical protein